MLYFASRRVRLDEKSEKQDNSKNDVVSMPFSQKSCHRHDLIRRIGNSIMHTVQYIMYGRISSLVVILATHNNNQLNMTYCMAE